VYGPDVVELAWRECGTDLGEDARSANLDTEDLHQFERVRVAYGISA
jgi:hypothetical protein